MRELESTPKGTDGLVVPHMVTATDGDLGELEEGVTNCRAP